MSRNKEDAGKFEAKSLYLDFIFLKSKEKKLLEENADLKKRLEQHESRSKAKPAERIVEAEKPLVKGRRIRKTKTEIVRDFECTVGGCGKAYG